MATDNPTITIKSEKEDGVHESFYLIKADGSKLVEVRYNAIEQLHGMFLCSVSETESHLYDGSGRCLFKTTEGESLEVLNAELFCVKENGKVAVYNSKSSKILNFIFDEVRLVDDVLVVRVSDKVGIFNKDGRLIIDPSYNKIECVIIENNDVDANQFTQRGHDLIWYKYPGYCLERPFQASLDMCHKRDSRISIKRNVISVEKERTLDYPYEYYRLFTWGCKIDLSKNFILYKKDSALIFNIEKGILPFSEFDGISPITNNLFVVKTRNTYGVYSSQQNIKECIKCEFEDVKYAGGRKILYMANGLWGVKVIDPVTISDFVWSEIAPEYQEIEFLDSTLEYFSCYIHKEENGRNIDKYTVINDEGQELFKYSYYTFECHFSYSDKDHFLTSTNGKFGFVSIREYVSIPFIYDEVTKREDGNFDVRIDKSWGILSRTGAEVARVKYNKPVLQPKESWQTYDLPKGDIVQDTISGNYGYIDQSGAEIIPCIYRKLEWYSLNHCFNFTQGDLIVIDPDCPSDYVDEREKWGLMDEAGCVIIPQGYHDFRLVGGYIIAEVSQGGNCDLYDSKGNFIFGGFNDFILDRTFGFFIMRFGGEWKQGEFDSHFFDESRCRWLVLDKDLRSVILPQNHESHQFKKGFRVSIKSKRKEDGHVTKYWNVPLDLFSTSKPVITGDGKIMFSKDRGKFTLSIGNLSKNDI